MAIDQTDLLSSLRALVDKEISSWQNYLNEAKGKSQYEAILSTGRDDATKARALIYILQTLPTRHATLVDIYDVGALRSGEDPLEDVRLPEVCENLLSELKDPDSTVELRDWYRKVLYSSDSMLHGILETEKLLQIIEQERLRELHLVKAALAKAGSYAEVKLLEYQMESIGLPRRRVDDVEARGPMAGGLNAGDVE